MPRIYVDFMRFSQMEKSCQDNANSISKICNEFYSTVKKLDWDIRLQPDINSTALALSRRLSQYEKTLKQYSSFLKEAESEYKALEAYKTKDDFIIGGQPINVPIIPGCPAPSADTLLNNIDWEKLFAEYKDKNNTSGDDPNIGDITDWFSHLFDAISKKTGDDDAGLIGGTLGLISSIFDMFTNDNSTVDKISKSLTDFSKELTSFIGDLFSDSNKDYATTLGLTSAILATASGLISSIGKTPEDFLKDSGGLITSGSKLAQKLYEECVANGSISDAAKADVGAIAAPFTMGTRAVGNVISYSKDGCYDLNDYGNTLLNSGIAGASSLIKFATFGLVKFDVNDTANVFTRNADNASAWIHDLGLPAWAEVVTDIVASPVVAIQSVVDVVVENKTVQDVARGIGDGISIAGQSIASGFSKFFSGESFDLTNNIQSEIRNATSPASMFQRSLGIK